MESFNQLSPAQVERLALLAEEMGEAIQAIGKVLRHGLDNYHPHGGPLNRTRLEFEMGDVLQALDMLVDAGDLSMPVILEHQAEKKAKVSKHLHHQEESSNVK